MKDIYFRFLIEDESINVEFYQANDSEIIFKVYKGDKPVDEKNISEARAEIFRITRILEEYSQHEMARKLEISPNTYSALEHKTRKVEIKYVEKYTKAFGISMENFLKAEEETAKLLLNKAKLRYVGFVVCKLLRTAEEPHQPLV